MRFLTLLIIFAASAHGSANKPSNYFYRVSPAGAPLKRESAYYAKCPEYPEYARKRHLTGCGLFALYVGANGRVARVEIIHSMGHDVLDQAAIAAFRRWQFRPGSIDKVRVPIRYVNAPFHMDPNYQTPLKNYGDGVLITIQK